MTNFGKQTNQAVRPFFKMLAGIVGLLALLSIIPPLIGSDGSLRSLVRLIPEVGFALTFLYFSLSRREKSGQGSQAYGSPDRECGHFLFKQKTLFLGVFRHREPPLYTNCVVSND
jgi:hypothetical protein